MIFIGAVYRGPELKGTPVEMQISRLMRACAQLRGDFRVGTAPAINVVFHVPGSLGIVSFKGIRDGKFSRRQQLLMVQVSVPKELPEESMHSFFAECLHRANTIAFQYFRDRNLDFPLAKAEKLTERLQKELTNPN